MDTNIFLDVAIDAREEHVPGLLLWDEFLYGEIEGYVAATSLKDVYYILGKYEGESRSRDFIEAILKIFQVVPVDALVCKTAIRSNEPDFEDGIVRECAESIPVDFIISRDKSAFGRSYIKCLTAQEYLDFFCDIEEIELPK
ncbi:MAG: PIN domain-containing protein [Eggerthella sp.]|nr:PIN domain-containing protein [Eggerthella sp.]